MQLYFEPVRFTCNAVLRVACSRAMPAGLQEGISRTNGAIGVDPSLLEIEQGTGSPGEFACMFNQQLEQFCKNINTSVLTVAHASIVCECVCFCARARVALACC